jgi:hypothetical protein
MIDKVLEFFKVIQNWNRVAMLLTTAAIVCSTYYAMSEIDRYDKFSQMNPWEYFSEQEIRDQVGLSNLVQQSRIDTEADIVAIYMYQPKELNFYRTLVAISPNDRYSDYVNSEQRIPLYNIPKLLTDLRDANISIITAASGHYDSKLLIAMQCNVAYVLRISAHGIDIGHIMFVYKKAPTDIPWDTMKSIAELSKLKIF